MKKLFSGLTILVLLSVIFTISAFFFLSSDWFLRKQVLPRAEKAIGISVSADKIELSPFSKFRITGLVVGDPQSPLVTAATLDARYQLLPLLKRRLVVDSFLLDGVFVSIIQDKNGNLNLPKCEAESATPIADSGTVGDPPEFEIRNVQFKNLNFKFTQESDGDPLIASLTGLNIDLKEFTPEKPFEIAVSAAMSIVRGPDMQARIDPLTVSIQGELQRDLMPRKLDVNGSMALAGKAGAVDLSSRTSTLSLSINRTEMGYDLSKCRIEHRYNDQIEGTISITGTGALDPVEADVTIDADLPTSSPLNIIGSIIGDYDFGNTTMNYRGNARITDGGNAIAATGNVKVSDLTIRSKSLGLTPLDPMKIVFEHNFAFDGKTQSLDLQTLNLNVRANDKELVTVMLDKPAKIALDGNAENIAPATLKVVTRSLDLTLLKPVIPPDSPVTLNAGILSNEFVIIIRDGGQKIDLTGTIDITGLDINSGKDIHVDQLDLSHTIIAEVEKVRDLNLRTLKIAGSRKGTRVMDVSMTGKIDLEKISGILEVQGLTINPAPLRDLDIRYEEYSAKDFDFGNTRMSYTGNLGITENAEIIKATGELVVSDLTIDAPKHGAEKLRPLQVRMTHQSDYLVSTNSVRVNQMKANIADLGKDIIQCQTREAATIDLDETKKQVLPLSVKGAGIDITLMAPYIPKDTATVNSGTCSAELKLDVDPLNVTASISGNITISAASATLAGYSDPLPNITKKFIVDMDYDENGMVVLKRCDVTAKVDTDTSELASMSIIGMVNPALDKPGSTLTITSTTAIDAFRLEQLLPKTAVAAPTTSPATTGQVTADDVEETTPMWLTAKLDINKIIYKDIILTELKGTVAMEGMNAKVDPVTFKLNGGNSKIQAQIELPSDNKPMAYKGDIDISGIPFKPFIMSFLPGFGHLLDGNLKSLAIKLDGKGTDLASITKSLITDISGEIDSLAIQKSGTSADLLLDVLLLKRFGMDWTDLAFTSGILKTGIKNGKIDLANLSLSSNQLRIGTTGTMDFGGGWTPNLAVTAGFRGQLAERNARSLSGEDADGYKTATSIALKSWDYKKLAMGNVTGILESSGVIDAKDSEAIKAGLDIGKEAGKALKGLFQRK